MWDSESQYTECYMQIFQDVRVEFKVFFIWGHKMHGKVEENIWKVSQSFDKNTKVIFNSVENNS